MEANDITSNIFYVTTEESTINPYSSYPSFLELLLVDASRESGNDRCLLLFMEGLNKMHFAGLYISNLILIYLAHPQENNV